MKNKYKRLEYLREQIKNNKLSTSYYKWLKDYNKNDKLYGWLFSEDAILCDTLDDLLLYNEQYIDHILNVYIGELEEILNKTGVKYED